MKWIWLGLLCLAPSAAQAEETLWNAEGVQEIEVHSASGHINVIAENRSDVAIDTEADHPSVRREGTRLYVQVAQDEISLRVPSATMVSVSSASGELAIKGNFKRLSCNTASGDIEVDVRSDDVTLESLSGDLTIRGQSAVLRVETVSGQVILRSAVTDLRLRTTSGDIDLEAALPKRIDLQTVSGDVDLRGTLLPDAVLEMRTVSGDVGLQPHGNAGFRVVARTRSGDLDVGGATLARDAKSLDAQLGAGRARIEIMTLSGDVRIER